MSASLVTSFPAFGFLNLGFGGSFRGVDFDHDAALGFSAIGLPPGVALSEETTIISPIGGFTADAGTNVLTFSGAHHLQVDDVVRVSSSTTLPPPLAVSTDYYVIASGLTATECKLSASLGGAEVNISGAGTGTHSMTWFPTLANGVQVNGTPTVAGIYDVTIAAGGFVSGLGADAYFTTTLIVEGGDYLAYYHLDYTTDPPTPRNAIDLQYNVRSREFASVAVDVEAGIEVHMGEELRIHLIISRNGTRTLSDYTPDLPETPPTEVALIVRPSQQFDGPAYLHAEATATEAIGIPDFTARNIRYVDVTIGSRRLERIFRQLNAPNTGEPSSAAIDAVAQLSFVLDGRRHTSPPLPWKFLQTYKR